jgi:hypothetical protein
MLKKLFLGLAVAVTLAASYAPDGTAAEMGYAPQISNEREIKVTVTPQNLSREASTWDFEVILETHTQALSDDLARSSVLIADGMKYLPMTWEGAPPGGHHRKGLLRFKAIIPQPRSLELQLRLANDPAPRSFKWMLK